MSVSVLLIGAGGLLGKPVVQEFIAQKSHFSKIGILSDPSRAQKFSEEEKSGIEIVKGWFLDPSVYKGYQVVVSLVGNALFRLQPGMIEAAVRGGVEHFYASEFGADIGQHIAKNVRYYRDKFATRAHLVSKAKEIPGFKYTLLMTALFTELCVHEIIGLDHESKTLTIYGSADTELDMTSMADIARYLVQSILLPFPSGQQKRELRVSSSRMTWRGFAKTLGAAQGVTYKVVEKPREEALVEEEKARKADDEVTEMDWSFKRLLGDGVATVPGPLDNDKFDFTAEPAETTLQNLFLK